MGQRRKIIAQDRCETKAYEILTDAKLHKKVHPEISNTAAIMAMIERWEKDRPQEKTMVPKVLTAVKTFRRHGAMPSCLPNSRAASCSAEAR